MALSGLEHGEYSPVIGLEIHAELRTASKMFCPCRNDPDEKRPNFNICPVCMGHPGVLPALNREAVRHVLRVGAAVGGQAADFTEWDRKNYFYPDIPKGYQISQYEYPLISGGRLSEVDLERIHLEEDTARSTHDEREKSLVDFNRSGLPLMELVTKPVIRDAASAVRFAKELQLLLRYLDAGQANLEKGEMRIEANVSVARTAPDAGGAALGVKTEIKNLNSFRAVERAIGYEIARQVSLLRRGESVVQETRGWDDKRGETYSQRSKESSHDYRYFPDPDVPKMKLSEMPELSAGPLRAGLPELPWARRERFRTGYGMTDKETAVMVESPALAAYFDEVAKIGRASGRPFGRDAARLATNYLLTDYVGLLKKERGADFEPGLRRIGTSAFAGLMALVSGGRISSKGAKELLSAMLDDQREPEIIAGEKGLIQKSDAASLEPAVDMALADNAKVVAEYRAGKTASIQFLIGAAMKAAKGAGNPAVIKELLIKKLS